MSVGENHSCGQSLLGVYLFHSLDHWPRWSETNSALASSFIKLIKTFDAFNRFENN